MADERNQCAEYTEEEMFKEAGECSNEHIILTFDDGQKLYVPEQFLCCASLVFKAMFKHDFKEKETREIMMKEKSFEDVHEFLLCLHPAVQKLIDNKNVLRLVALADEYQAKAITTRCKETMKKWILSVVEDSNNQIRHPMIIDNQLCIDQYTQASACLKILKKVDGYNNYEEIVDYAIETLGKFGYNIITGLSALPSPSKPVTYMDVVQPISPDGYYDDTDRDDISNAECCEYDDFVDIVRNYINYDSMRNCSTIFNSLTEHLKARILLARLRVCDDGKLRE